MGEFLPEFDIWLVKNQKPPCFNSLIDWLQVHHDASQLTTIIDGFDFDLGEDSNFNRDGFDNRGDREPRRKDHNKDQRSFKDTSGDKRERGILVLLAIQVITKGLNIVTKSRG